MLPINDNFWEVQINTNQKKMAETTKLKRIVVLSRYKGITNPKIKKELEKKLTVASSVNRGGAVLDYPILVIWASSQSSIRTYHKHNMK